MHKSWLSIEEKGPWPSSHAELLLFSCVQPSKTV